MAFSRKEPELAEQLPAFADGIAGNIGLYQVSQPDADAISAAVAEFIAKRAIWTNPATKTPGALEAKNASKIAALGICRVYYRAIQLNNGISDQAKVDIGVTPISNTRTSRDCPQSAPVLNVTAATNGAHVLGYNDSMDQDVRRKPEGADGLILFRCVGTEPETDLSKFLYYRKYTTKPMPVFYDPEDCGKIATYYGCWIGQRGDTSTRSAFVSMAIAA